MTEADLVQYLARHKAIVEAALDKRLPDAAVDPVDVHRAMRYAALGGGKRLRPIFMFAVGEVGATSPERMMDAACAVELVHAASLVLDDLPSMDDASERRGQPATHVRFGEATALLAVMGLVAQAFELLATRAATADSVEADTAPVRLLAQAMGTAGLTGGQHQDLRLSGCGATLDQVEHVHHHQAGALFVAAGRVAAALAGLSESDCASLERYALNVGLAFQATDDLLDASNGSEDAGKSTLMAHLGTQGARERVDALVARAVDSLTAFGDCAATLRMLAEHIGRRLE